MTGYLIVAVVCLIVGIVIGALLWRKYSKRFEDVIGVTGGR